MAAEGSNCSASNVNVKARRVESLHAFLLIAYVALRMLSRQPRNLRQRMTLGPPAESDLTVRNSELSSQQTQCERITFTLLDMPRLGAAF